MVFKDVRDVSWTNTRPCLWCFVFVFSSIVGIETVDCHFLTCPFLMSGCTLKGVQVHYSWVSSGYWNLPGMPGMAGKNHCRKVWTGSWSCSNHHEHHFLSSSWWKETLCDFSIEQTVISISQYCRKCWERHSCRMFNQNLTISMFSSSVLFSHLSLNQGNWELAREQKR